MKRTVNNGYYGCGWRGDFDPVQSRRVEKFSGLATITTSGRLDSVVAGGYISDTNPEYTPTVNQTERFIISEVVNRLTRLPDGSHEHIRSTGPANFTLEATEYINDGNQNSLEDFTPDTAVHFLSQRPDGLYVVRDNIDPVLKRLVGRQVLDVARNLILI